MDFVVDSNLLCFYWGHFLERKQPAKNPPEIHDFHGSSVVKIHSMKFCFHLIFMGKENRQKTMLSSNRKQKRTPPTLFAWGGFFVSFLPRIPFFGGGSQHYETVLCFLGYVFGGATQTRIIPKMLQSIVCSFRTHSNPGTGAKTLKKRKPLPRGPNIENIQDFASGFRLSSDQSQIEIFNRD